MQMCKNKNGTSLQEKKTKKCIQFTTAATAQFVALLYIFISVALYLMKWRNT